jgi:hypothetical protein
MEAASDTRTETSKVNTFCGDSITRVRHAHGDITKQQCFTAESVILNFTWSFYEIYALSLLIRVYGNFYV